MAYNDTLKEMLPFLHTDSNCTLCGACVQSCSKGCIFIENDVLKNDFSECINCNKCVQSCHAINTNKTEFAASKEAFAVWSLDETDRKTSTSGGAASVFYQVAVDNGYYICGAEFNKQLLPVLTVSREKEKIKKYKQSKYVYSMSEDVFSKIKELLLKKECVLFIALPCQVAALKQFLGKPYNNLITVDIVCHGTPSSTILEQYINNIDVENKATQVIFREDNQCVMKLLDNDSNIIYKRRGRTDPYLAAFLDGLSYRDCCYSCSYARPERVSDITIGDFWGLGQEKPFNHPYTGSISLVLLNTEKGKNFFEKCKYKLFYEQRDVIEAIKGNAQLQRPTNKHTMQEQFWKLTNEKGFEFAVNICLSNEMKKEKKKLFKNDVRLGLSKIKKVLTGRK